MKTDIFLQKMQVVQRLNKAHYATVEIVQVLVEHLFFYQEQGDWHQKRSSNQVFRTRNNKKVNKIKCRNQSMMSDPNYSILDEDSSSEEEEGENSLLKVKQSLASTGNNNVYQLLLMLVNFVIKVIPKIEINCKTQQQRS